MRSLSILAAAGVLCACVALCWQSRSDAQVAPPDSPAASPAEAEPVPTADYVVHEWGTFTSFSGSNGVKLEFRPLVDNDLPHFVLDRAEQSGQPCPFAKASYSAYQRMETPVLYFYTDSERDVSVRVDFPKGLITEFYPPVAGMLPNFDWETAMKGEPLGNSMVDWGKVRLIPTDRLQTSVADEALAARINDRVMRALVPPSDVENHYTYARETDAALVHVHQEPDENRLILPTGDFFEKFLFYRGLGNFELPLDLQALPDGRFRLVNAGPDEVRGLFLVQIQGDAVRFEWCDGARTGETLALALPEATSTVDELKQAVEAVLTAEGLYPREAQSMVHTWESSWFGEEGTRLFYIVPRRITDELLPLRLDPAPRELVRVLVGRMEIMTPSEEQRVMDLVARSQAARDAAAKQEASDEVRQAMLQPTFSELLTLGRLAEPALTRVKHIAPQAALRYEANYLMYELRTHYEQVAAEQAKVSDAAGG
jgi:hypothetical protein